MKTPSPGLLAGCALTLCVPPAAWTASPPKLREIPVIEKLLGVTAAPKHGEQSVVGLTDGRPLLLWSGFLREDLLPANERPPASPLRCDPTGADGYARISGKTSADGGRTWSGPLSSWMTRTSS